MCIVVHVHCGLCERAWCCKDILCFGNYKVFIFTALILFSSQKLIHWEVDIISLDITLCACDIVQSRIAHRVHYDIVGIGHHYKIVTIQWCCNCNPLQLFIVEFVSWNTTTVIVALQCQLCTITCNGWMQNPSPNSFSVLYHHLL